jgi:tetratricopeptide (TPR) repeat protein
MLRAAERSVLALAAGAMVLLAGLAGCHNVASSRKPDVSESRLLLDQARLEEASGRRHEAAEILKSAIRRHPDDPELQRELARILVLQGNPQAAIERLRGAIAQRPDDIRCSVQLADTLFRQGAILDAEPPLDAALGINPRDVEALLLRARLHEAAGRREEALETYYRVLAVNADHIDARLRIGAIHLEESRCECAAALLRSIATSDNATPEQRASARRCLGRAYYREGRWDDAAIALSEGLAASPGAPAEEWYELAVAARRSGRPEMARAAVSRTLLIEPRHAGAVELAAAIQGPTRISHAGAEALAP